jgi:methylmalonyl-CoA/ethylmalonyl-CoA epimerase
MNMLDRLSHVSVVVPDLEVAAAHLSEVFGLVMGETMVNREQGVRIAYIELANIRVEVMQPLAADTPLGRFLQKNPLGALHHIAFAVDSVAAVAGALGKHGVHTIGKPGAANVHGARIDFIHPRDFIGALVELEEAVPPPKAAG